MNERIKLLRKELELNQKKFGLKLGVSDTAISKIEKGINIPSKQTIKSICREFNVNYIWLTEGTGEMFSNLPESLLDEISEEYDLDNLDKLIVKSIVKQYMELTPEKRNFIRQYFQHVMINKKNGE